jgi:anti-sigma-K factor RskA
MNDNLHIAETDLTLYAMGALLLAEATPIEEHLAVCARCREELRQNTLALAAYAQSAPPAEPPAGSKTRFMARLAETPQVAEVRAPQAQAQTQAQSQAQIRTTPAAPAATSAPVTVPDSNRASFWQKIFGGGWSPLLAGAFALLLIAVGADDLRNRAELGPLRIEAQHGAMDSAQLNQLMELLTSPQAKRVALHPGPVAAPPPEGRVVYTERTGKLLLTASNLHPLPDGKTYELWILQPGGKAPLPAGTFAPDSKGNAEMILADEPAGLAVAGFGVTIENAGGSKTPTLPIVLSGL